MYLTAINVKMLFKPIVFLSLFIFLFLSTNTSVKAGHPVDIYGRRLQFGQEYYMYETHHEYSFMGFNYYYDFSNAATQIRRDGTVGTGVRFRLSDWWDPTSINYINEDDQVRIDTYTTPSMSWASPYASNPIRLINHNSLRHNSFRISQNPIHNHTMAINDGHNSTVYIYRQRGNELYTGITYATEFRFAPAVIEPIEYWYMTHSGNGRIGVSTGISSTTPSNNTFIVSSDIGGSSLSANQRIIVYAIDELGGRAVIHNTVQFAHNPTSVWHHPGAIDYAIQVSDIFTGEASSVTITPDCSAVCGV